MHFPDPPFRLSVIDRHENILASVDVSAGHPPEYKWQALADLQVTKSRWEDVMHVEHLEIAAYKEGVRCRS